MRKLYSNGLTVLLILAVALMCMPMDVFAEESETPEEPTALVEAQATYGNYTYDLVDGGVSITKYNGSGGNVTIPDRINGDSVVGIGPSAFYGCTNLTNVTLPATIQSVGYDVFRNCTNLESVTLQPGISALGEWMFYGCTKLASMSIPESVDTIPYGCFYGCANLTALTIENGVKVLDGYAFYECDGLTNINIPGTVTEIKSGVFANCDHLKSVTIGNGTQKIDSGVFTFCKALTTVRIPASVNSIADDAFYGCNAVNISGTSNSYAQQFANAHKIPFTADNPKSIQLNTPPTKVEYLAVKDTTINTNGGKLDVTYSNGSKETIDIDSSWCSDLDASKIGKQTITVTYAGLKTSFDIHVYPLGDVNGDTNINAADALLDLQHSVQIITLPTEGFRRGDVNIDNAVRADDALKILQYSVKIINEF